MDFKVAGTREGITGIQLDLKARGLSVERDRERSSTRPSKGRLEIIEQMEADHRPAPRANISQYAPRIVTIKIDPDKIGKLIGPGGKTIRGIQEQIRRPTSTSRTTARSWSPPAAVGSLEQARRRDRGAVRRDQGRRRSTAARSCRLKDFGAFIEIAPGTDGMCHISELAEGYVKKVTDVVKIGDIVKVKVINVDDQGRIKLSRKAALAEEEGAGKDEAEEVAKA